MTESPWTEPEPRPGAFDADLVGIDPRFVELHTDRLDGVLRILLSVEGDDVERLERISAAHGKKPSELISELLREAD